MDGGTQMSDYKKIIKELKSMLAIEKGRQAHRPSVYSDGFVDGLQKAIDLAGYAITREEHK